MPDALIQYGVVVLFAWTFAVQAGMPVPAGPILIGAGVLSGSGEMSLALAIVAATGATLGADVLWYSLGRSLGTPLRYAAAGALLWAGIWITPPGLSSQRHTVTEIP